MRTKLYGCAVVVLLLSAATGVLLYSTRYLAIERGFDLKSFQSEGYIFDAWSYGDWQTTTDGTLTIETYCPPYTLVLAIGTEDPSPATVEIVEAALVERHGATKSIISTLAEKLDSVQLRPGAAVRHPYAAFQFKHAIPTHENITLQIEFEVKRGASIERKMQQLIIPAYEKTYRSFTFLERIMSV